MPGHSNKESRRTNLRSVPGWALNESLLTGSGIVPTKWVNKAGTPVAESAEGRESPKGNDVMVALVPDTEPDLARTFTA